LRTRLLPGLLRAVEHNWAVRERDIRLFEVGTVFRSSSAGAMHAPIERTTLAAVLTGSRRPRHWSDSSPVPDMDIWDLKHHFELAVVVAAPGAAVTVVDGDDLWHAVAADGGVVGRARRLPADAPPWAGAVLGFEIEIETGQPALATYRPLPVQPPIVRDLSLVLPGGLQAAEVELHLRAAGETMLERLEVLDEYWGPNVPAGTRGVTWRCVFRDPARTLRDQEVDALVNRALGRLEGELHVRRRAG